MISDRIVMDEGCVCNRIVVGQIHICFLMHQRGYFDRVNAMLNAKSQCYICYILGYLYTHVIPHFNIIHRNFVIDFTVNQLYLHFLFYDSICFIIANTVKCIEVAQNYNLYSTFVNQHMT